MWFHWRRLYRCVVAIVALILPLIFLNAIHSCRSAKQSRNIFTVWWRSSCFLITLGSAALNGQYWQVIGFSPVCCRRWMLCVTFLADLWPHTLQMKGLIWLWTVLICLERTLELANLLLQMSHVFCEYHRSWVPSFWWCVIPCTRSWENCLNIFGQWEQANPFVAPCTWRCLKIWTAIQKHDKTKRNEKSYKFRTYRIIQLHS